MTTFIAIIVSLAVGFIAGALVYRRNARYGITDRAVATAS